jgi:hypothetical protein
MTFPGSPTKVATPEDWLLPSEKILWSARPRLTWLQPNDAVLLPFMMLWLGILGWIIMWTLKGLEGHERIGFLILAVPFVLFGSYMLVGRILARRRTRSATQYFVTTLRAVVQSGRAPVRLDSIFLDAARDFQWLQTSNVVGTLRIGRSTGGAAFGAVFEGGGMSFFSAVFGDEPIVFRDVNELDKLRAVLETVSRGAEGGTDDGK